MRSSRDKGPYKRCSEDREQRRRPDNGGTQLQAQERLGRRSWMRPGRIPPPAGASRRHPSSVPGLCCAWAGGGRGCGNGPSPTCQWLSDFIASPTQLGLGSCSESSDKTPRAPKGQGAAGRLRGLYRSLTTNT